MKTIRFLSLILAFVLLIGSFVIFPAAADEPTLEVLGAQIRTTGNQGIRFIGRVKKSAFTLNTGADANFGFLLLPQSMLESNQTLVYNTPGVKQVKATYLMLEPSVTAADLIYDGGYYYFTVVLTGIPAENYGTTLVAKAYVNTGDNTYVYSDSPLQEKRSIYSVARAIADKGGSIPAFVTDVIAAYTEVGSDILVNANAFGVLEAYPAYPNSIARDELYTVSVTQGLKTEDLLVYNQCAAYSHCLIGYNSRTLGATDSDRRFCEFAFEFDAVTVNIRVNKKFNSYVVSPTSKGFASTYSNGVISVTLTQPEYFLVILDDDYNTALAVFADHCDYNIPTKGASNVIYVEGDSVITDGTGSVTYAGTNNEVMIIDKDYTTLYVAPGAVLKKRVFIRRRVDNYNGYRVTIRGRGAILDPFSDWSISSPNQGSITVSDIQSNHNAMDALIQSTSYSTTVRDVKLLDSRGYNMVLKSGSPIIKNTKILSTEMCTDGISLTGYGGDVSDCFVYVGDNALVLQTNETTSPEHVYSNIIIGTTCAALYPQWNARVTLNDIYVFRADSNLINCLEDGINSLVVNINGLDALDCVKTPYIFADDGGAGSDSKVFNLKNVATRYTTGATLNFTAGTYTSQNDAMTCSSSGYTFNFTNLCVGGHRIGPSNDGSSIKVGSAYLGADTNGGTTQSGMTINFAYDSTNMPAHTSVPANKSANYTGGADYVAGPIKPWTRYISYHCDGYIENGQTKVTTSSSSSEWGLSLDLTNYLKAHGAGNYTYSAGTSGKTTRFYLIKCANNGNAPSTVRTSSSSNFTVTESDLANYTYQVILKISSTTSGTITLTGWSISGPT